MRVIVLGGTGHLGTAFCHELCHQHTVTSYQRSAKTTKVLEQLPVQLKFADLDDFDFSRAFAQADWVIDASAPYPLEASTPVTILNKWIRRYKNIFAAVEETELRYSYISSFITLERETLFSATSSRRSHPYYALKHRIEEIARHYASQGHNINIYCPSVCMGPWDRRTGTENIFSVLMGEELPFSSRHLINIIDVRDLASFVTRPASATEDRGQRRPIFGHNIMISEFCELASKALGVKAPPVAPDLAPLSPAALVAEAAMRISGNKNAMPALPVLLAMEPYVLTTRVASSAIRSLAETIGEAATYTTNQAAKDHRAAEY